MASSSTEICNIALSHIGSGKTIADLETEATEEAITCRVFYDTSVGMVLNEFAWPFAKKTVSLSLVAENPTTEWSYSYRYPAESSLSLRILSGTRNDTRQTRVPYKIMYDSTGKVIYSSQQDAVLEYIKGVSDTALFNNVFTTALSFLLAFYIAPRVTGGDPFNLGDRAKLNYDKMISSAKAAALNEEQQEEKPESEFILGRL